jgi:hypothetical protein
MLVAVVVAALSNNAALAVIDKTNETPSKSRPLRLE